MKLSCEQIARARLGEPARRSGPELLWLCPNHDDHHPSLSVNTRKDVFLCGPCGVSGNAWKLAAFLAGRDANDKPEVTSWLRNQGLLNGGLAIPPATPARHLRQAHGVAAASRWPATIAALALPGKSIDDVYHYLDESSRERFIKLRYKPKDFRVAHLDGNGNGAYRWGRGESPPLLYRLPNVRAAQEILLHEGERDVHTAEQLGFTATTKADGARETIEWYLEMFRGKEVIICYDTDDTGKQATITDCELLRGVARSLKWILLPHGKDITDWVEHGGTSEALRKLIDDAPVVVPDPEPRRAEVVDFSAAPRTTTKTTPDKYPALPEEAWFGLAQTYRQAVAHTTEANDAYHLAGYLTAAGLALDRSVHVRMPHEVYPNLFTALVGQSGKARKGTAMRYAGKLAKQVVPDLCEMVGIDSPEGFVQKLADVEAERPAGSCATCFILYPELRALADKAARETGSGLIPMLARAFDTDGPVQVNTRKTSVAAENTFTSLLGAASPSWLDKLSPADLAGGFGNRTQWVPGQPKPAIPWPPAVNDDHWNHLVETLQTMHAHWHARQSTRFEFTPEAAKLWESFYRTQMEWARDNEFIAGLADRLEVQVVKVAMIHTAVSHTDRIGAEHLRPAIAWGRFLYQSLDAIFGEFGLPYLAKIERRIIAVVEKAGPRGIRQRTLQQRLSDISGEMFHRALRWLLGDNGSLHAEQIGRSTWITLNPPEAEH